jgi:glycosyltransferase involved in cell wall biosynthesis
VTEPPAPAGGKVDFEGVLDAAGVDASERDLFAKAQALLGSLPPGTDPAVRRQIVEASLKAFGVPVDKIIEAGVESIQALEGYLRKTAADTAAMAREVQTIVAGYEQKIADARALLDRKLQEQASVQTSCNSKKLEVQKVLEFFGQEEVARVVKESPRLIEPAPAPERKD